MVKIYWLQAVLIEIHLVLNRFSPGDFMITTVDF
jgi:hypothetical protein